MERNKGRKEEWTMFKKEKENSESLEWMWKKKKGRNKWIKK